MAPWPGFSPTEIFKRATAATLRAIAERDDVTVGFGAGAAGRQPARGCSCPTRRATCRPRRRRSCAAPPTRWRLRLRYHDDAVHAKRAARRRRSRARSSRRVEQARVEALGARRMAGVAANLDAMLDEQYRRQGFERITERTESTMAEAVRLLTREALTREPPPPAARQVVDLWRPWLEGKHRQGSRRARPRDPRPGRLCAGDPPAAPGSRHRSRRAGRVASSDEQPGQGEEAEGENQSEGGESAHRRRAGLDGRRAGRRRRRGRARTTATPRPTAR